MSAVVTTAVPEDKAPLEPSLLKLHYYQAAAIESFVKLAIESGTGTGSGVRAITALPTGCGKTILGLELAFRMGRTLWMAHRTELISQPLDEARTFWHNREYGIVKAERNEFWSKNIVFASIDSAAQDRRIDGLLASHNTDPFRLIVVDEAHHCSSDSKYAKVLEAFPKVHCLGLTATPERHDGASLAKVFRDGLIYRLSLKAAISGKYLVPPSDGEGHLNRAKRLVLPGFDPSKIPTSKDGDFDQKELEKAMLACHAGKAIAEAAVFAVKAGRKTIIFTMSIAISLEVVKTLTEQHGITAKHVDGTMTEKERADIIAGHKAGEFSVMSNCQIFVEGYNDKSVTCMIMGKPTKSRPLYVQMLGRGLRAYPGKTDCLVIDVCGVDAAHGLQTADTVMDDEPKALPKKKKKADQIGLPPTPDDMILRLRKLLEYVSGQADVEADQEVQQSIEWVPVPNTAAFALDAREAGLIILEPRPGGKYDVIIEPKDMSFPPVLITPEPTSIEVAQAFGENHVRSAGEMRIAKRDAYWRRKSATPGQVKFLESLGVHLDHQDAEDMNMGTISRLITQHSAKIRLGLRYKRPAVRKAVLVSDF